MSDADADALTVLRGEITAISCSADGSILQALTAGGLAASTSEARRLLQGGAVSLNGQKVEREQFEPADFKNGKLLLKKGKRFKDSVLVELG